MVFKVDDSEWTLDLRPSDSDGWKGTLKEGGPVDSDKPDLTLTISDDNFVKLVMGKMGPQQVLSSKIHNIVAFGMAPTYCLCCQRYG